MNTISQLTDILRSCRTIAIVGLSAEWHRPSFFAAKYMQSHGYKVVPVNPRYAAGGITILDQKVYPDLSEIPFAVDMVDIFRRTDDVLPFARQSIAIGARCLWQQIGVVNDEADRMVRDAGLHSVMDRCVKIEHARLFGGLNWVGVNTAVISAKRRGQAQGKTQNGGSPVPT